MLRVELESDDFDKNGGFVKIGAVAMAIARANGATNLLKVERKIFPRINHAVQMGLLIPLDPETLNPLSKSDYGNGIVSFAELAEWGCATHPGFDFLPKIYPSPPSGAPKKNGPPAPLVPVITPAVQNITLHKLKTNTLDVPIEKAIKQAGNLETAAVWLKLKELALAGEAPFTGTIDGSALCYTNDDNQTINPDGSSVKFRRDALRKRLEVRRQMEGNGG